MKLETLTAILSDEFGEAELGELLATARDESAGICLACHAVQYGCEPDARRYECESCGGLSVYGAEELVMMALV